MAEDVPLFKKVERFKADLSVNSANARDVILAAAAVNVTSPAGPDSPDNPIYLFATEPLVAGTPFLDWRPAPAGAGGKRAVFVNSSDERVSLVNHDAVDGTATRRWRLGYRLVVAAAARTRPGAMRA